MKYFLLLLVVLGQVACSKYYTVKLGEDKVHVQHWKGKGKTYVHVHHNEETALKAARAVIQKQGGSLITLVHPGGRNVVFHLNDKRYEFDPNRIFTDEGIKKTLAQYSQYTPEAHREVSKLSAQIKHLLPEGKVVAVHNNSSYSLKDYLPGHELASEAKALYLSPSNYYRNFYLVTKYQDYSRLKSQGFNGVLQKPSATDDGSLSILLSKNQYINVEAGYDQLKEQIKMLEHA